MEIKTERLVIREISHGEAKQISKLNDPKTVNEYLATLDAKQIAVIFKDKDAVADLLNRFRNSIDNGDGKIYGALKDGLLIGFISIVTGGSEIPELQIEIAPSYHGKGYGYEFMASLLPYLFEYEKYDFIRYTVLPTNAASIALIKKIGAFPQSPKSKVEKLLIQTYLISRLSMNAYQAHAYSSNHKPELEKDDICGCFSCQSIFKPSEIAEWIIADNPCDKRGTAVCPYCGIDSVIGRSSGYPITQDFLAAMNRIWFGSKDEVTI